MANDLMTRHQKRPWGLILLFALAAAVMIPLSLVDYEWTLYLSDHRIQIWGDLVRSSLFDGDAFGGSDPGIILMLISAVAYFLAQPGSRFPRLQQLRPHLGFLLFSALFTGLSLVHSTKLMVGRARPYLIVKKGLPFTHWFEFGPQHVSNGMFFGSFPSGHTATAILMITFAYILAGDRTHSLRLKALGWLWGISVLLYSCAMVIGRSMTLHHWLTDSIGIILLDWIAIHLIYFYILRIPRQVALCRHTGRYPGSARYWELKLLWRVLLITLGVMATVIGIKAVIFQDAPQLILMLVPALPVIYYTVRNLKRTHRTVMASFNTKDHT